MRFRYYLRGLGLGIAVTALMLHFAPDRTEPMSDNEIMERARELGMTEKISLKDLADKDNVSANVVVDLKPVEGPTESPFYDPGKDEGKAVKTPEQAATSTPTPGEVTPTLEPAATATPTATAAPTPTPTATLAPTKAPTKAPTATPKPTATATPTATAAPTPSPTATPVPTKAPTATPTPTPAPTATPVPTSTPTPTLTAVPEDRGGRSQNPNEVEISVTPGDSSYTVAKRLAEAGVVPSAAEFDEYLCRNGFDRKIATGMHKIPAYTDYRRIGEILSGH